ncbi:MAG: hypothetical protein HWN71_06495 [Desulfobacterales bacterium]|nr:hypothetical protein [Desulfobacterales bacterium]
MFSACWALHDTSRRGRRLLEKCHPADRPWCPEEIAAAITLLGSVEPRYVTGSNQVTGGGMTAW